MENITVSSEKVKEIIQEALPAIIKSEFTSSYSSNPINKIVKEAIDDHAGEIRKFVKGIIASAIKDDGFKQKLSDEVVAMIIEKGLSR